MRVHVVAKLLIPPELFLPRQENGFRDLNIILTGNQKLLFIRTLLRCKGLTVQTALERKNSI